LRTWANRDSVDLRLGRGGSDDGRREEGQGQFFYEFNLDAVVPPEL
jgi:hypothetical protein